MDVHGCSWIFMDFHGFSWMFMDFPVSSCHFMGKFHVQTDTNWVCHWKQRLERQLYPQDIDG